MANDGTIVDGDEPVTGRLRRVGAVGAATTLAGGSALAMITALAGPAASATFTVTQATDDGTGTVSGTLSWAIAQAEADAAADVIDFSPSLTTITFSGNADQVAITQPLSIQGPGADSLTIDLNSNCGLVANLNSDATLDISGVTLSNGSVLYDGCTSRSSDAGGALAVYGGGGIAALTISGVTIQNNYAYYYGGGLSCSGDAAVTIENSRFLSNTSYKGNGGGAYLDCAQNLVVSGSSFIGNTSTDGDGGGADFRVDDANTALVVDSTFSGNTGGWGGAANFENGLGVVRNSTFSGNTGNVGGALAGDTPITIQQSTISENTSSTYGGGVHWRLGTFGGGTYTTFSIVMSTISGNTATSGDGNELSIDRINSDYQAASIVGSIVAGTATGSSVWGNGNNSLSNFPVAVSYSAIGTENASGIVDGGNNLLNLADPQLGALADNGGSTETMEPLDGSPVIGAGPATVPVFPDNSFDQRGTPYARIYDGTLDIGAVEAQPGPEPTTTSTSSTSTSTSTTSTTTPDTTEGDDPVVPEFTG